MLLHFTPHALLRMRERGVKQSDVRATIEHPDRLAQSSARGSRFLAARLYQNRRFRSVHALLVVYEQGRTSTTVVTVIDTSKTSKYV
ncbi:MAG: DUF4258 domain-containing protein [bacterium]|nr:DUF4258 domain-containing protein [bacterium]